MKSSIEAAKWMLSQTQAEGCVYQDDVVDYLIKGDAKSLLRENPDGNLVLGRDVLNEFRMISDADVVWVKSDRYWRVRVAEDESGREARG